MIFVDPDKLAGRLVEVIERWVIDVHVEITNHHDGPDRLQILEAGLTDIICTVIANAPKQEV